MVGLMDSGTHLKDARHLGASSETAPADEGWELEIGWVSVHNAIKVETPRKLEIHDPSSPWFPRGSGQSSQHGSMLGVRHHSNGIDSTQGDDRVAALMEGFRNSFILSTRSKCSAVMPVAEVECASERSAPVVVEQLVQQWLNVPKDAPTISRAICMAGATSSAGNDIVIQGSHVHSGDLSVRKSVRLVGDGPRPSISGSVTLDCGMGKTGGELRGLNLIGGAGTNVLIISGVWEIRDCHVNVAEHGCGIKVGAGAACILFGCTVTGGLQGMHFLPGSWGSVKGSIFNGSDVGIFCSENVQVEMDDCKFSDHKTLGFWHKGLEKDSVNASGEMEASTGHAEIVNEGTKSPMRTKRNAIVARPAVGKDQVTDDEPAVGDSASKVEDNAPIVENNAPVFESVIEMKSSGEGSHRKEEIFLCTVNVTSNTSKDVEDLTCLAAKIPLTSPDFQSPSRPRWSAGKPRRGSLPEWRRNTSKHDDHDNEKEPSQVDLAMQNLNLAISEMTGEVERNGQMIRLSYIDYVRSIDPIEKALEHLVEKHEKEKDSLHEKIASLQAELKGCQSNKEVGKSMVAEAVTRARHMNLQENDCTHSMTVTPVTMSIDDDDDDTEMLSAAQEALSRAIQVMDAKTREAEAMRTENKALLEKLNETESHVQCLEKKIEAVEAQMMAVVSHGNHSNSQEDKGTQ